MGVAQGLTEFLPVSSTAHLRLIPRFFGWPDGGVVFDAALHAGTLLALLLYFWKDWVVVLRSTFGKVDASDKYPRGLFWGIVLGCIPAGIVGLAVKDISDSIETNPNLNTQVMLVIATMLIVVGIVIYFADNRGSKCSRKLGDMKFKDYLIIGCAQAAAVVWGVSRSGATISAGRFLGLERDAAARYSFLLSTPVFIGFAGLAAKDLLHGNITAEAMPSFVVGVVTSAVVGMLVIRFLLGFLRRHSLSLFVWYRIALGAVILTLIATHVL